jgi:4-oxalocrotonate tautomerase
MPVITVQMRKVPAEKKKELIEKLTSAAVEVTNTPASSYTVFIEEYELDNIGIGGQTLAEKFANK